MRTRNSRRTNSPIVVSGAWAAVVLTLAGCSSSDDGSVSDIDSSDSGASAFELPSAAAQRLEQALQPISEFPGPDDTIAPPASAKVTVITCSATGETCVRVADGVEDAGDVLGWDVTVVDGKGQPSVWNSAMSTAIAGKTQGIVLGGVPPALVGDGLAAAKAAGIPVIYDLGLDAQGADALVAPDRAESGRVLADYVAEDSGGNGTVLLLRDPEFPELEVMAEEFKKELADVCPDCTLAGEETFTLGGMAQELPGIVQTAVQTNPDIEYVVGPFDATSTFVNQGVRAAAHDAVKVLGTGGDATTIKSLESGDMNASMGVPAEWLGFQSVDAIARVLLGQEIPSVPVVQGLVTADNLNDVAPNGSYDGGFDYAKAYKAVWDK